MEPARVPTVPTRFNLQVDARMSQLLRPDPQGKAFPKRTSFPYVMFEIFRGSSWRDPYHRRGKFASGFLN